MYAFKEAGSLLFLHYGSAVAVGSVCKPQVASEVRKRLMYLHNHRKQHMHLLKRDVSSSGAEGICATFAVFYLPGDDDQKAQHLTARTSFSPLINPSFSASLTVTFIVRHDFLSCLHWIWRQNPHFYFSILGCTRQG